MGVSIDTNACIIPLLFYTNVIFIIIITFFKYLVMRSIENYILLRYGCNVRVYINVKYYRSVCLEDVFFFLSISIQR